MRPISLPHLVARLPHGKDGYCACAHANDSDMICALFPLINSPALKNRPLFNALQPNFACVVPENETGTVTVAPGGTLNVVPNGTCAVLVAIEPVLPVPLTGVVPVGAPPPPPEFASAALLNVI